MALTTPLCDFGAPAKPFDLLGTDGHRHNLENTLGANGLLVMFICNHCPYVQAVLERILRDTRELKNYGINAVAIQSNDTAAYPEDSWDNMVKIAREKSFPFPYVLDESQSVARAYQAVCTPDFFGYNAKLQLQYRGRIDSTGKNSGESQSKRELFEAMVHIAKRGQGPKEQHPSMGCSIKWKN